MAKLRFQIIHKYPDVKWCIYAAWYHYRRSNQTSKTNSQSCQNQIMTDLSVSVFLHIVIDTSVSLIGDAIQANQGLVLAEIKECQVRY